MALDDVFKPDPAFLHIGEVAVDVDQDIVDEDLTRLVGIDMLPGERITLCSANLIDEFLTILFIFFERGRPHHVV
jgi:hypothetical protein